jgi:hypothetical protein
MQDQTKQTLDDDIDKRLERTIVLRIVGEERDRRCSRADLAEELDDVEPNVLAGALARLDRADVIALEGPTVRASRATVRLDQLELIAL